MIGAGDIEERSLAAPGMTTEKQMQRPNSKSDTKGRNTSRASTKPPALLRSAERGTLCGDLRAGQEVNDADVVARRPLRPGARKNAETLALLGFFDHGFWADYYDYAFVGDGIFGAIGFGVVADDCTGGQIYVAIDDGVADAAAAADVYVIKNDTAVDFAVAVDAHVEAEDGLGDAAS